MFIHRNNRFATNPAFAQIQSIGRIHVIFVPFAFQNVRPRFYALLKPKGQFFLNLSQNHVSRATYHQNFLYRPPRPTVEPT